MQRSWLGATVVLVAMTFTAGTARGDVPAVLEQVPHDAPAVVVAPSLADAGQKIALLNQRLGLEQPMLADPIEFVQTSLGIREGLDLDGAAALMLLSLPDPQDFDAEPTVAMLLPVTDYADFLGNFDAQGDGDVRSIHLMGEQSYVRHIGDYALLSDSRQAVEDYHAPANADAFTARAGTVGVEALTDADLFVIADVEQLGPHALMMQAMAPRVADDDMDAAVELSETLLEAAMTQGRGAVLALRVSEQGIGFDTAIQFRDDTDAANAFAAGPDQRPALDHLPASNYLVAGAVDLRNLPIEQWLHDARDMFDGDDQFSVSMRQMLSDSILHSTHSQVLFDPQFGFGGSLFNGVTVSLTDDPEAARDALRQDVADLHDMPIDDDARYQTSYDEQVMQIDGVSIDRYSLRMDFPPEAMAELGPAAMFVTQDMGGHVAVTDHALIVSNGTDTTLLEQALRRAANADDNATLDDDEDIRRIRQHLNNAPAAEMFLNVRALLEMANELLVMFDPDAELQVPDDLPPLGFSASIDAGGIGNRTFVPMQVIDTFRNIFQQFGGDTQLQLGAETP